jgi:Icc-related predicted phosphoesterase
MRVIAISDLHGTLPKIPECDVLVIAGDICPDFHRRAMYDPELMRIEQRRWLLEDYAKWEEVVPAKRILCTPGNHDWTADMPHGLKSEMYIDQLVEVDGKRFWFTPWSPLFYDWNFMLPRGERKVRFADIPKGLDVLVSHAPPHNCLDQTYAGDRAGCPELRLAIYLARPRYVVCGHIHEGQRFGCFQMIGPSMVTNVAMFGPDWVPTVLDI